MKIYKFELDLDQHQFFTIHNYQIYTEPEHLTFQKSLLLLHPQVNSLYNDSMKLTTTISFVDALIAKSAFAGNFRYGPAFYADGHQDNSIWVNGDSGCQYVYLGPYDSNPCAYKGGWFELDDVWYQLVGCGSSEFCIRNKDGSTNSCAEYAPEPDNVYTCVNKYGYYFVNPEWYFP